MKKTAGVVVLIISVIMGIYLTCFFGNPAHYSEYVVSKERFDEIIAERSQVSGLLNELVFEEETLMFDSTAGIFYYSLVEGNSGAYDPCVVIKSERNDVKAAFLESEITKEGIRNNQTIPFLVYTDEVYAEYALKCTTLPLMSIECGTEISEAPVPMKVTLFDNRQSAVNRTTVSDGTIHVRGNTTKIFPKQGYRFSLTQESIGDNTRSNQVSLLGMRQDDDWLLYAAYNDQEKIRNVFSSNLWEYSCGTDNAQGINTGMEYKYLELFINGEYWGLYALGFPIDEKQLMLNPESGEEGLYKVVSWFTDGAISFTEGGNLVGFRIKGAVNEAKRNWAPLLDYYYNLSLNSDDNEKLYAGIDIDNAIDIYLFVDLIQGLDHAMSCKNIKNIYLSIRNGEEGPTALYSPWDMDTTWGNAWVNDASLNLTVPYALSASNHVLMQSGYLNQIIINGEDAIWEKIFDKYRELRLTGWSEESINSMLDEYEEDIYASGAYLREMERWPQGSYTDASEGLSTFRSYVMERLKEMDLYYESLELSHDDGREAYQLQVQINTFSDLSYYLEALLFMDYQAVIEINNTDIWQDRSYLELFEKLGVPNGSMNDETGFIVLRGMEQEGIALDYNQMLEGGSDTPAGYLSILVNKAGGYEVYLDDRICYNGILENEDVDIRIVLLDSGSGQLVDDVAFSFELDDTQEEAQIVVTGFRRQ